MDQITDILVIVNPLIRDQAAVAKAAALARWLGAGIELLICDTSISREAHMEGELPCMSNARRSDNLESLLGEIAEPLRDDGIDITTHVISGDPLHEAVIHWMRNSPADLVVKDAHHHLIARRAFATSTARHLMRTCPVPILLTKPRDWATPPLLMAAVDPGHVNDAAAALDHRILDVTASMAQQFDMPPHAVHAYVPTMIATAAVGGMLTMIGVSEEALASEKQLRRAQIMHLTDEYGFVDANVHVDPGIAPEYLPRMAAEWHADIVVMGAVSRSGLTRAVIGSTAERVLETLPCDVLVVKSPDFAHNLPF